MRIAMGGCAISMALAAAPAGAQETQSTDMSVKITQPGKVSKLQDLEFGAIIPGTAGGTVVVRPDGTRATTGTVIEVGQTYPAAFNMQRRVLVDYPAYNAPKISDSIVLTHVSDPGATMQVTNFANDFNRRIKFGFFNLPAYYFETNYVFHVGGTLHVKAGQKPGVYRGYFVVEINYN